MTLAAGSLNRQIAIKRRTDALDAAGQSLPGGALATVATLWANPRGQTGMGAIRAAHEGVSTAVNRYSFRIRFNRSDFDVGMILDDGVELFDIVDIRHDLERREWTDLVCEVGAVDG